MVTISVEVLPSSVSLSALIDAVEGLDGIHYLKILARE